ncbi:D-alanyl-D-alanine carboxypeptidase [Paucibacter sp. DJ1R-11]|uniref:D-alanyl-D-alanine carboxypeptidase family protein n=1 Tax=Paucibacter sp. DJ1R-11 TaxID=2893556 RepID=UPI0021E508B6|nr:D-alanyl-D-alanine carboxypeptidase family protein [Paucibacter sp. DJ1R-11]MCV2366362.1 D-alanyl-D-alanine carboxypeptidase [Paucibacter sp. DJ1R-11]
MNRYSLPLAFSLAAAAALVSPVVLAQAPAAASQAQAASQMPGPEIAARSYLLLDMSANRVLSERDADTPNDPASLTKLMTAYVVFGALRDKRLTLDQTLPVSTRAWDERKGDPSLMFINTTMTPKVDELLRGMIIQSGNDASVALAEGVAGTVEQFVALMNRQAQAWGLKNTQFKNVTGMTEPGHKSSARDLSVIASSLIRDFPEYYSYYSQRDFTFNKIRQDNRNLLLRRDPSVDGMKTGYTEAAGYCLVSSAQREFPNGKRRLLSVVMGTASKEARATESQKLLNWGYSAFDAVRLFDKDAAISTVPVWKGASPQAKLGAAGPVFVAVPRGDGAKLQTQIERTDPLVAPLSKGQRVGTLKVSTAGGVAVAEVPLVVLEEVPLAGILGRAWDAMRLWIK